MIKQIRSMLNNIYTGDYERNKELIISFCEQAVGKISKGIGMSQLIKDKGAKYDPEHKQMRTFRALSVYQTKSKQLLRRLKVFDKKQSELIPLFGTEGSG